MKKITLIIVSLSLAFATSGCGAKLREAALNTHEESVRIYEESNWDLYKMSLTARLALCKSLVRECIADGTSNELVPVKAPDGSTVTLKKVDSIINQFAQANADMAMIRENIGQAKGFSDLSWIYMESRQSFIERAIEDLKDTKEKAKAKNAVTVPVE